jgi:hypothetical protein
MESLRRKFSPRVEGGFRNPEYDKLQRIIGIIVFILIGVVFFVLLIMAFGNNNF